MNIALLHYSAPPIVGGVESVMAHQARCMADAGHTVCIVAARGQQTDPRIPFVCVPLADSTHVRVASVKAELDAGRVTPAFDALTDELKHELADVLRGVDVLVLHNVCSLNKNLALTAALHALNRQPGFPRLIVWHHDLAWTTPRYQHELHAGMPWDLLRTAWPDAQQVAISDLRRDELARLMHISHAAISVVPNGLDIARFYKLEQTTQMLLNKTRLLEADLILLLPVRITPRKNIELALRTLAELHAHFSQPMLVVTGPRGPHNPKNIEYFQMLLAQRHELGMEHSTHFLAALYDGFLPDEVIGDFFRLADALFLPSREEGFGLPMLEAAISRMPIFCTDIAPLRALGEDNAIYFSPDADPRELAAQIAAHMHRVATYRSAARMRATYTWGNVYQNQIEPLLNR